MADLFRDDGGVGRNFSFDKLPSTGSGQAGPSVFSKVTGGVEGNFKGLGRQRREFRNFEGVGKGYGNFAISKVGLGVEGISWFRARADN